MTLEIADLRHKPEFFDTVADRIWRAWWEPHGIPLAYISGRLQEGMAAQAVPFALVAYEGARFAGTASVIDSDLDERPQYTPWVAAVWVEPDFRSRQLGRRLVDRAVQGAFAAGHARVYLTARPQRRSYYDELGWTAIEDGVGDLGLTVFVREAAAVRAG